MSLASTDGKAGARMKMSHHHSNPALSLIRVIGYERKREKGLMKSHSNLNAKVRMPARMRGFTLIETLVAVSFGSSIMLTAVALVHTAFKLQSLTRTRLEETSTLDRFVEQFRRDANLADRVELPSEKTLKLFFLGELQVEYLAEENQITRRLIDGDELLQVEQVRLEAGRTARFTQSDSARCVVLDILGQQDNPTSDAPRTMRRIVVAVGGMNAASIATPTQPLPDTSPSDSASKDEPAGNAAVEEQP